MLFIMEGIDLAGVVDSDFQGIQINFAPPRPAGFANFRGAGRGKTCFFAGRGGVGRGAHPRLSATILPMFFINPFPQKMVYIKNLSLPLGESISIRLEIIFSFYIHCNFICYVILASIKLP